MNRPLRVHDEAPGLGEMAADVLCGLRAARKTLPCKYLYDDRGAELFERICDLEAYYPTRVERSILESHGAEMGRRLGPRATVIEFGSGSAVKTELLLELLERPGAYVPIDISRAQLRATAERLAARFPRLKVLPVCGDYTRDVGLPREVRPGRGTVVFFPGSTIGNFEPADAAGFLRRVARLVGSGGAALVGADRQKDPAVLERAYDDPEGVTAAFNLNLLLRINRELGANFDVERFEHRAVYDAGAGRIEMHLVSACDQIVRIPGSGGAGVEGARRRGAGVEGARRRGAGGGSVDADRGDARVEGTARGGPERGGARAISFRKGEKIVTEHSYKYTVEGFSALAGAAGMDVEEVWSDANGWFSLYLLRV